MLLLTGAGAMAAGALVALQSKVNAQLSDELGGSFEAAWISFFVGLIAVGIIAIAAPAVRRALVRIPAIVRSRQLWWWQLLGGVGGAWLVTTQGIVVPVVGVTLFMVSVVAGQVVGSLFVDRAGLSPAGVFTISLRRALAALLAVGAVILAAWPSLGVGGASWVLLAAVVAGAGTAFQQAINSHVSVTTGQPFAATTVNFMVGLTALSLVVAVRSVFTGLPTGGLPGEPWLYLGGPIGVLFIALAAWAVKPLGVLAFALLAISGQLLGSVLIDFISPTDVGRSWELFVGLLLIAIAVVLSARWPSGD